MTDFVERPSRRPASGSVSSRDRGGVHLHSAAASERVQGEQPLASSTSSRSELLVVAQVFAVVLAFAGFWLSWSIDNDAMRQLVVASVIILLMITLRLSGVPSTVATKRDL